MVSATGVLRNEGFPYALDNGAWTAFQLGKAFDAEAFKRALDAMGECADFIVLPDIVSGGLQSLEFSLSWVSRVRSYGRPLMLPVQDGMTVEMVDPELNEDMGIFIGGSTEFKEATMYDWTDFAHCFGHSVHVGRVNSQRRLKMCQQIGVDSFDGSGPSRFLKHAKVMDRAFRQGCIRIQ